MGGRRLRIWRTKLQKQSSSEQRKKKRWLVAPLLRRDSDCQLPLLPPIADKHRTWLMGRQTLLATNGHILLFMPLPVRWRGGIRQGLPYRHRSAHQSLATARSNLSRRQALPAFNLSRRARSNLSGDALRFSHLCLSLALPGLDFVEQ